MDSTFRSAMSSLRVEGEVLSPCDLDYDALALLPDQVDDIGALVPGRQGGGVRLRAVLGRAGLKDGATHLTCESTDGAFAASVPLSAVRNAVVAYRLGDQPLSAEQGGPLRFFIPDTSECATGEVDQCANVKFLGTVRVTRGRGRDTRPTTDDEHAELHKD